MKKQPCGDHACQCRVSLESPPNWGIGMVFDRLLTEWFVRGDLTSIVLSSFKVLLTVSGSAKIIDGCSDASVV